MSSDGLDKLLQPFNVEDDKGVALPPDDALAGQLAEGAGHGFPGGAGPAGYIDVKRSRPYHGGVVITDVRSPAANGT